MRVKSFLKDFGFVIISNLLTLAVSTLIILIVPKIIGIKEYGYWQIFMFYSGYLGLLPLGWLDGIYLRYGGLKYEDVDKNLFKSQFIMLMLLQVFFATIIIIFTLLVNDNEYTFILFSLAIYLIVYIAQSFCKFILQITNKIKEYSTLTILSNGMYVITVLLLLIMGITNFHFLIVSYIFGNFLALLYGIYILKDIFFSRFEKKIFWNYRESLINIRVGSQLLIANVAAMLIIGVVRMGIQKGWGVSTFGKVSLTLSISNLLMIFINAISLVLFPKLKRINNQKINEVYPIIRDLLMPLVFVGMLIYFPIDYLIPLWLPKYDSALIYMSILFPMVVYQSKFEILSNTFMKVLRMEKQLLFINIFVLLVSSILTIISVSLVHNLTLTIFTIIIVMGMRSIISEFYIKKRLEINVSFEVFLETMMIIFFIFITWYFKTSIALLIYSLLLIFYLYTKKNDIISSVKKLKLF